MTLVVDASAVVEILFGTARGVSAISVLGEHHLVAPQHLTAEVTAVIRGWSLGGYVTEQEVRGAFADFEDLGIEQMPMIRLLPAVHALRHNISSYDAMYVVLARALECKLLTLDARLARAAPDCAVMPVQEDHA